MTPRQIKRLGWRRDLPDPRDRIFQLSDQQLSQAVPPSVDLTALMPPVYDQGQLGSCTGNGIARVLEYQQAREGEAMVTPSRLFIYYEERVIEGSVDSDSGAEIRDGIKVVASKGAPPETDWPYDIAKFADKPPATAYQAAATHRALSYQRIIPGIHMEMRAALAAGNPIVFGFTVPAYFEDGSWDPKSEPLPVPGKTAEFIGGHCCVISGYDWTATRFRMPVFRIENSWGPGWGDAGRFWMPFHWFDGSRGLVDDLWVVTRTT